MEPDPYRFMVSRELLELTGHALLLDLVASGIRSFEVACCGSVGNERVGSYCSSRFAADVMAWRGGRVILARSRRGWYSRSSCCSGILPDEAIRSAYGLRASG